MESISGSNVGARTFLEDGSGQPIVPFSVWESIEWSAIKEENSAFRQKFPKLWTSVAHSFLQQIAQNKKWAHPKASTLPRICKVEMQQASLLHYSAQPQTGGILRFALRHFSSEPFDSRRCRTLPSARSVFTVPCVVTLPSSCRCSARWSWSRRLIAMAGWL